MDQLYLNREKEEQNQMQDTFVAPGNSYRGIS